MFQQEYLALLKQHEHSMSLAHAGAQFRRQISVGLTIDFDRPPDGASLHPYPGTSCLATINLSLRDKNHSPIEAPHNYLSAYRLNPGLLYTIRSKGADIEYFSPETGWPILPYAVACRGGSAVMV